MDTYASTKGSNHLSPCDIKTRENSPSSLFNDSKEIILRACNISAGAEPELQRPLF